MSAHQNQVCFTTTSAAEALIWPVQRPEMDSNDIQCLPVAHSCATEMLLFLWHWDEQTSPACLILVCDPQYHFVQSIELYSRLCGYLRGPVCPLVAYVFMSVRSCTKWVILNEKVKRRVCWPALDFFVKYPPLLSRLWDFSQKSFTRVWVMSHVFYSTLICKASNPDYFLGYSESSSSECRGSEVCCFMCLLCSLDVGFHSDYSIVLLIRGVHIFFLNTKFYGWIQLWSVRC